MAHKQGCKLTRGHTTLTELALEVVRFLEKQALVSKISIGFLSNGGKSGGSKWVVRIIDESNCVLVTTSQSATTQELRFYTSNRHDVKLALARFVRNNGWELRFGNRIT